MTRSAQKLNDLIKWLDGSLTLPVGDQKDAIREALWMAKALRAEIDVERRSAKTEA